MKTYSEASHLRNANPNISEVYNHFRELALAISTDMTVKPMKQYIAFAARTNVTDVVVLKNSVYIYLNMRKDKLDDPKQLAQDVPTIGYWGNGDYRIHIKDSENLDYIMSLVCQSYHVNS